MNNKKDYGTYKYLFGEPYISLYNDNLELTNEIKLGGNIKQCFYDDDKLYALLYIKENVWKGKIICYDPDKGKSTNITLRATKKIISVDNFIIMDQYIVAVKEYMNKSRLYVFRKYDLSLVTLPILKFGASSFDFFLYFILKLFLIFMFVLIFL